MKKGAIVVADFFKNNRLFNINDKKINRDNCLYPNYLLKKYFAEKGIELVTHDSYPVEEYEFLIFQDFPLGNNKEFLKAKNKKYLIIYETELISPQNWKKKNHEYFEKIFTWNDSWVDNGKYIKCYLANEIPAKC